MSRVVPATLRFIRKCFARCNLFFSVGRAKVRRQFHIAYTFTPTPTLKFVIVNRKKYITHFVCKQFGFLCVYVFVRTVLTLETSSNCSKSLCTYGTRLYLDNARLKCLTKQTRTPHQKSEMRESRKSRAVINHRYWGSDSYSEKYDCKKKKFLLLDQIRFYR